MATSIRDLLHAIEQEAPYLTGTARQARDAAGALSELGRALQRLACDGLGLEVYGSREKIVLDLADSCAQNAVGVERDRSGRLTTLAGGVADTVGTLREQVGREERWAIAAEVATAVRVVSTYAAEGDGRRTADLAWTHLTARGLATQATTRQAGRARSPGRLGPHRPARRSRHRPGARTAGCRGHARREPRYRQR